MDWMYAKRSSAWESLIRSAGNGGICPAEPSGSVWDRRKAVRSASLPTCFEPFTGYCEFTTLPPPGWQAAQLDAKMRLPADAGAAAVPAEPAGAAPTKPCSLSPLPFHSIVMPSCSAAWAAASRLAMTRWHFAQVERPRSIGKSSRA